MVEFQQHEIEAYYQTRLPDLNQRGHDWRGKCPIHGKRSSDDNFSVEASTGRWYCHSACQRGGDIIELEQAITTAPDFRTAKDQVFQIVGRVEPPFTPAGHRPVNGKSPEAGPTNPEPAFDGSSQASLREAEAYSYRDRNGNLLFEVVRYVGPNGKKTFRQRRPDGNGEWIWDLQGVDRVPYRLPEILEAKDKAIFLVEGERDVHSLERWGLIASTNPGGSGSSKLYENWGEHFRDRYVFVLPDNDTPGRRHAIAVASAILPVAKIVRIVELPGLAPKGDFTDWQAAGSTVEQFREIVKAAPNLDSVQLDKLRTRWEFPTDTATTKEVPQAARPPESGQAGSLITRLLADIQSKPVSWLWPDRIARGKVSIIAGNPGLGKSQITTSIAAVVTTGGRWPVDRQQCQPGDVLFLTAEDDPADTLRPRLEAAGADLTRVHFVDGVTRGYTGDGSRKSRAFSLEEDLQALEAKLTELGNVAVVVIDPVTAYLGETDSHKNAEVRALLAPLSELAARHNVAIIGVSHLNKAAGTQALMRVTGSLAFVAAARAAYLVTADPQDKTRRLFLPMKNNLGPDSTGLAFRIEGTTVASPAGPLQTSRIAWEPEAVTLTADEAMQAEATPQGTSALAEAKDWLRETLTDGPIPSSEIFKRGEREGISKRTLKRASKELGIEPTKAGMGGGWSWSLPKSAKTPEEFQERNLEPFDEVGTLRGSREAEIEL